MRVRTCVKNVDLHTERQWAALGYVKNKNASGEEMWVNRFCQKPARIYYDINEVHKATSEELTAYRESERERYAAKQAVCIRQLKNTIEKYGDYKYQKLSTCAEYYGYDWGNDTAHDSLADCKATLFCYNAMKGE